MAEAFSRKNLAAMGLSSEQVDVIVDTHTQDLEEIKEERDKYRSEARELEKARKRIEELEGDLKQGDRSPYKKKYEDLLKEKESLQAEFDTFKSDVETKAAKDKQRGAYRKLLAEAGVSEKRIDSVLKLAEVEGKLDGLEFEEDGSVKDVEGLSKAISEDYADYIVSETVTGANTAKPPTTDGGSAAGPSRAAQIAARYHANLYGEEA